VAKPSFNHRCVHQSCTQAQQQSTQNNNVCFSAQLTPKVRGDNLRHYLCIEGIRQLYGLHLKYIQRILHIVLHAHTKQQQQILIIT
jgi:hypothetical protein